MGFLVLLFPLYYVFSPEITNYFNRTEFDQKKWKEWEETETTACLRWDMTNDLIEKHKLIGLSTQQIIDLLGKPNVQSTSGFRYDLGMSRHGIDTGMLLLSIKEGKVISYEIING